MSCSSSVLSVRQSSTVCSAGWVKSGVHAAVMMLQKEDCRNGKACRARARQRAAVIVPHLSPSSLFLPSQQREQHEHGAVRMSSDWEATHENSETNSRARFLENTGWRQEMICQPDGR